jgi:hypothetical protein
MTTKRQCDGCNNSTPINPIPQLPSFRGILPGMGFGQPPLRGLQAVPVSADSVESTCSSDWISVDPHGCGQHTLDFCSTKCAADNVERVVGQLNVRIESERKEIEKQLMERGIIPMKRGIIPMKR